MSAVQVNFRTTPEEKRLIAEIARRLERREGDALRFIVRKAARELDILPSVEAPKHAA